MHAVMFAGIWILIGFTESTSVLLLRRAGVHGDLVCADLVARIRQRPHQSASNVGAFVGAT
jgi:hypothetical protein